MTKELHPNRANFRMVLTTKDFMLLEDVGPRDVWLTITNGVDGVVKELIHNGKLQNYQRLFYIDSMNDIGEIKFTIHGGFERFEPLSTKDDVANLCRGVLMQIKKYSK